MFKLKQKWSFNITASDAAVPQHVSVSATFRTTSSEPQRLFFNAYSIYELLSKIKNFKPHEVAESGPSASSLSHVGIHATHNGAFFDFYIDGATSFPDFQKVFREKVPYMGQETLYLDFFFANQVVYNS